jgi:hypothetical protein
MMKRMIPEVKEVVAEASDKILNAHRLLSNLNRVDNIRTGNRQFFYACCFT